MKRTARRTATLFAAGLATAFALAACGDGDGDPLAADSDSSPAEAGTVTVGSANFPENVLLAEIYAKALEAKGVEVERKLNIGSREVIYSQIESGGLTVLPEYNGALLAYLDESSPATATEEINAALEEKLPASLQILDSSSAEDKDSLAVTAATAEENGLTSIEDLAPVATGFVLGGPPEFKTRQQGIIGLESVYGLTFEEFRSLDTGGPLTVAALEQGDVDVANLFSTDPAIVENGFVVLEDPKNVFGAQNVTPLVNKAGVTPTVTAALDAVSAELDTATLLDLMKRVVSDKEDADEVAADWLSSVGLV